MARESSNPGTCGTPPVAVLCTFTTPLGPQDLARPGALSQDTSVKSRPCFRPVPTRGGVRPMEPPTVLGWSHHDPTTEEGREHPAATEGTGPAEGPSMGPARLDACTAGEYRTGPTWPSSSSDPLSLWPSFILIVLLSRLQMR